MAKKFKVLRVGISQQQGDHWVRPSVGTLIELSDAAAHHFLSEGLVAEVEERVAKPIPPKGETKKEEEN